MIDRNMQDLKSTGTIFRQEIMTNIALVCEIIVNVIPVLATFLNILHILQIKYIAYCAFCNMFY